MMMWLAVECKQAYMVPCYNSSIFHCHVFLLDQIKVKSKETVGNSWTILKVILSQNIITIIK